MCFGPSLRGSSLFLVFFLALGTTSHRGVDDIPSMSVEESDPVDHARPSLSAAAARGGRHGSKHTHDVTEQLGEAEGPAEAPVAVSDDAPAAAPAPSDVPDASNDHLDASGPAAAPVDDAAMESDAPSTPPVDDATMESDPPSIAPAPAHDDHTRAYTHVPDAAPGPTGPNDNSLAAAASAMMNEDSYNVVATLSLAGCRKDTFDFDDEVAFRVVIAEEVGGSEDRVFIADVEDATFPSDIVFPEPPKAAEEPEAQVSAPVSASAAAPTFSPTSETHESTLGADATEDAPEETLEAPREDAEGGFAAPADGIEGVFDLSRSFANFGRSAGEYKSRHRQLLMEYNAVVIEFVIEVETEAKAEKVADAINKANPDDVASALKESGMRGILGVALLDEATVHAPGTHHFIPYDGIDNQKVVSGEEGRQYIVAEVPDKTPYGDSATRENIATPATTGPLTSSPSGAASYDPAAAAEDEVVVYDEDGKRKVMVEEVPDWGERGKRGLMTPAREVVLPKLVPPPPPPKPHGRSAGDA